MNYYFLLEDEKSFIKVLPKWLNYMKFPCTRVASIKDVSKDNYVMQSGQGVTQLITCALYKTLDTILDNEGTIDVLVVIVDAEQQSVEERRKQVQDKIEEYSRFNELNIEIKILVCNHCFESWLLANKEIYPKVTPKEESFFYPYYKHYNISELDPEHMPVPNDLDETIARYHFHYLHDAFLYNKIRYNKNKPDYVAKEEYFNHLVFRMKQSVHIRTFKELWDYIQEKSNM